MDSCFRALGGADLFHGVFLISGFLGLFIFLFIILKQFNKYNSRKISLCGNFIRMKIEQFKSNNFVTLPLTTKLKGDEIVPYSSGLNWGQRENRNPDQAYISIPAPERRSGFFPQIGVEFDILCDDGFLIKCVRAQQNGKALQSKPE